MQNGEYRFTLVIVGARNLKNVGTFGKMDPYARIIYGDNEYKTTVLKDAGCSPNWNYEMSFKSTLPSIRIEVYDSQLFKDKMIGFTDVSIGSLSAGMQNLTFDLYPSENSKEFMQPYRSPVHSSLQRRASSPYTSSEGYPHSPALQPSIQIPTSYPPSFSALPSSSSSTYQQRNSARVVVPTILISSNLHSTGAREYARNWDSRSFPSFPPPRHVVSQPIPKYPRA